MREKGQYKETSIDTWGSRIYSFLPFVILKKYIKKGW